MPKAERKFLHKFLADIVNPLPAAAGIALRLPHTLSLFSLG